MKPKTLTTSPISFNDDGGPLSTAELRLLDLNRKVLKENGRIEPPDVDYELMVALITAARKDGRRKEVTNLDNLARIARKHGQV